MTTTPKLRDLLAPREPAPPREELTVITVRLPCRLHEALKEIAHLSRKSLNAWCVDSLHAQAIEDSCLLEADAQHPDAIE